MASGKFTVLLNDLAGGKSLHIEINASPDELDLNGDDALFNQEVSVKGEAYLAGDELIIRLDIKAQALLPCKFCNELVVLPIDMKGVYITVPLAEIKSGLHDYEETVRENILLETPSLAECHGGHCPERAQMDRYLRKEGTTDEDQGQRPFANL